MANKFRDIPATPEAETEKPLNAAPPNPASSTKSQKPRKKGVLAKGLSSVFSGTFLTSDRNVKHLPFVIFLACMAVLYIANGYYADDKIREFNKLSNQLKELRSEYISTKSELMFASKQSEVAKAAFQMGLKESLVPPIKIKVDSSELYTTHNTNIGK